MFHYDLAQAWPVPVHQFFFSNKKRTLGYTYIKKKINRSNKYVSFILIHPFLRQWVLEPFLAC